MKTENETLGLILTECEALVSFWRNVLEKLRIEQAENPQDEYSFRGALLQGRILHARSALHAHCHHLITAGIRAECACAPDCGTNTRNLQPERKHDEY